MIIKKIVSIYFLIEQKTKKTSIIWQKRKLVKMDSGHNLVGN